MLSLSLYLSHPDSQPDADAHVHTKAERSVQLFTTDTYLPASCRMAFVRLPFHPVAADSPHSDNT